MFFKVFSMFGGGLATLFGWAAFTILFVSVLYCAGLIGCYHCDMCGPFRRVDE